MSFSGSSSFQRSGTASLNFIRARRLVKIQSDSKHTDIHDYLKSDMGEKRYKELKNCESLRLHNIYIRSTALHAQDGEVEKKGYVNHEAMVIEMKAEDGTVYHILAEKIMDESGRRDQGQQVPSGIVIEWVPDFSFNRELDVKFECFGVGISLREVLDVLKNQSPEYDLIKANCWQYAATATCQLIKKLLDKVQDDVDVSARLRKVLDAAEKHLNKAETLIPTVTGMVLTTAAVGVAGVAALAATLLFPSQKEKEKESENENENEDEDVTPSSP